MFVPVQLSIAASTFRASSWIQELIDKPSKNPVKMYFNFIVIDYQLVLYGAKIRKNFIDLLLLFNL